MTLGGTVNLGFDRRKFAAVLWGRTMSDFETRLKDVSQRRLADLDSQRARARRLRVGADFEISAGRGE